jgi:hypothetical protein
MWREEDEMTIAAGFRFSQGILLCADTQNTVPGVMKLNASKIVVSDLSKKGGGQLAFALSASSVPYAHMAIERCVREVKEYKPKDRTGGGIRLALEDAIEDFHQRHVYPHPNFVSTGTPGFQLLIAARSDVDKTLMLYATNDSAVTEVRDYDTVGAGSFLAHYLIPTIFRHSRMGLADTANVAIHILRETKDYVDSCGMGSEFVVLGNDGKISNVEAFDISSSETISRGFRDAMRRIFVVAADLDTTEQQLKEEFELARLTIEGYRDGRIIERNRRKEFIESLGRYAAGQVVQP